MSSQLNNSGRQARTATIHFLSVPHNGTVAVQTVCERVGRSLTTVTGRMLHDGKVVALALAAFAPPRDAVVLTDLRMPVVDPPGVPCSAFPALAHGPASPFSDLVVMEPRLGAAAFSGVAHAEVGGWLRLREERPLDALAAYVLIDAWFPTPWVRVKDAIPAPSIEMTVHLRTALPRPDTVVLGRFRNRLVREGYFEEDGEASGAPTEP